MFSANFRSYAIMGVLSVSVLPGCGGSSDDTVKVMVDVTPAAASFPGTGSSSSEPASVAAQKRLTNAGVNAIDKMCAQGLPTTTPTASTAYSAVFDIPAADLDKAKALPGYRLFDKANIVGELFDCATKNL